MLTLELLE